MNLKKKLERLGPHYKVERNGRDLLKWAEAIKSAAKSTDKTIDQLYDTTFGGAKVEDKPKADEKKVEVAKVVEGEVIPPGQPVNMKIDGANQTVNTAAPALNFHLAPASVEINPGNVSWAYTLQRSVMYAFVFFSGSMFGVLGTLVLFRKVI